MFRTALPKAKLAPLLGDTEALLRGTALTDVVRSGGRRWKLHSLEQPDEVWADGFVDEANNLYQAGRFRQVPAIAAALVALGADGGLHLADDDSSHPPLATVEDLFTLPDDATPEQRQALSEPVAMVEWRRREIVAWLTSGAVPPEVIGQLYNGYLSLAFRRKEVMEKLGPFAINPLTGRSSATSSPGKGS